MLACLPASGWPSALARRAAQSARGRRTLLLHVGVSDQHGQAIRYARTGLALGQAAPCRAVGNGKAKEPLEKLSTACCIIGSGPGGHTAAIYTARAELKPVMFEGFMACDVAPGGQLTMTTLVENYPGFPKGVMGLDLMTACRERAVRCGTTIFTETVERVDLTTVPFRVWTSTKEVTADALVVATGAYARRLHFPGADRLWNLGVSACAVCDGPSPCFRDCPLAVIGGGDTAMEYATYLAKYGSKVHVFARERELLASKPMQVKASRHPKIAIHRGVEVVEAHGTDALEALTVRHLEAGTEERVPVWVR